MRTALVSCLLLVAHLARAQVAPELSSSHGAGRPSDTGFAASATTGVFPATIPITFPPSRGGLPVPLSIVHVGGSSVGAAGAGWEVPLSSVRFSSSTAHRRPRGAALQVPERVDLSIAGQHTSLVLNAEGTAWVGRLASSQFELRPNGDGALRGYDGHGRVYDFSSQSPLPERRLFAGRLFLLRAISGVDGNRVELSYDITAPTLSTGGSATSINLRSLSYNLHPSISQCYKHKLLLGYGTPTSVPLSLSFVDGFLLARTTTLQQVSVRSRETCAASEKILSEHMLEYSADADLGVPRLVKATVSGQQGTPERYLKQPRGGFAYGSVLVDVAGGKAVRFEDDASAELVGPPNIWGRSHYEYGLSFSAPTGVSPQMLLDFNGDGRVDFLNNSSGSEFLYLNKPGQRSMEYQLVESRTAVHWSEYRTPVHRTYRAGLSSVTDELRQLIDMNADGRVDYVIANPAPTTGTPDESPPSSPTWDIWLNTPDPSSADRIRWVRRTVSVRNVDLALGGTGADDAGVPLARTTTVTAQDHVWCWQANVGRWFVRDSNRVTDGGVASMCPGNFGRSDVAPRWTGETASITEWKLEDVNGDGYPDFVFNASSVRRENERWQFEPTVAPSADGDVTWTSAPADLRASRDVRVLLNVAGVGIESGGELFSSPQTYESASTTGCGVSRWFRNPDRTDSFEACGLHDVNGDGLVDRVVTTGTGASRVTTARLGHGDRTGGFLSSATLTLPGPPSRVVNEAKCIAVSDQYRNVTVAGLRDVNGDGKPDYLQAPLTGTPTISFGTGTGFTTPSTVEGLGGLFRISEEHGDCFGFLINPNGRGDYAWTSAGLYDLDGDGQLEFVRFTPVGWKVHRLRAAAPQLDVGERVVGAPSAGRLVRVDNGHGGSTLVGYRSAKDDAVLRHDVPGPEIIIAATSVHETNGSQLLARTAYAAGGITNSFDPFADAFVRTGYRRTVTLAGAGTSTPQAEVVDTVGVAPFVAGMTPAERYARYALVGSVSSRTTLSSTTLSSLGASAWLLLGVDVAHDPRRTAGEQSTWDVRRLAHGRAPAGQLPCDDVVDPYDAAFSRANALPGDDVCTRRGLVFLKNVLSWRGTPEAEPGATSSKTVKTYSQYQVDDLGRNTLLIADGDLLRTDDDHCVATSYAQPVGAGARQLNAPSASTVTDCNGTTLANETFEYDTAANGARLPPGSIAKGFLTSVIKARLDARTGLPVDPLQPTIRVFDATYDLAGNVTRLRMVRDDGATKTLDSAYDEFGLVETEQRINGQNASGAPLPQLATSASVDPVTLALRSVTGPNGTRSGASFDGFGRVVQQTVQTPGAAEGVLAVFSYAGFVEGESRPRKVTVKQFVDPVAPSAVTSTPGRTATTELDVLGRRALVSAELGSDYGNEALVLERNIYDDLGRLRFSADPAPASEDPARVYGTTVFYDFDGRVRCSVRAAGLATSDTLDEAAERLPTCSTTSYANDEETVLTRSADSYANWSASKNVETGVRMTATGRALEEFTLKNGTLIERASFSHDALGRLRELTRWAQPAAGSTSPKTVSRWDYDSLSQVLEFSETGNAARFHRYDSWGNQVETRWDHQTGANAGLRQLLSTFDAYDRVLRTEERVRGVLDAETVTEFAYDVPESISVPAMTATFTLGRLTRAVSPTHVARFSYDGYGNLSATMHADTSVVPAVSYVEKSTSHANGLERQLTFLLPDNGYQPEDVSFVYDSADRLRRVDYQSGTSRRLYDATEAGAVDARGRTLKALFGQATYATTYAAQGRRMLAHLKVSSVAPLGTSREIGFNAFVPTPSLAGQYDPVGRERARREAQNGTASPHSVLQEYDAFGRLSATKRVMANSPSTVVSERRFEYDALGNVLKHQSVESPAENVTLSYATNDLDRLCSVSYGTAPLPPQCNVVHDEDGNVTSMPTRSGLARLVGYTPSGLTRSISQGGSQATFRYDAFGAIQQLRVDSATSFHVRRDKHFGPSLTERLEHGVAVLTRTIELPNGTAVRHGATGEWTYTLGEGRGARWVLSQAGVFVQDVNYESFGAVRDAVGARPGEAFYESHQWNDGDLLEAFGLSHLGPRMYDAVLGRFLSRDPLLIPRSATRTNPYAFAWNDPVNLGDPSGLDPEGIITTDCKTARTCQEEGGGSSPPWQDINNPLGSVPGRDPAPSPSAPALSIPYTPGAGRGGSSSSTVSLSRGGIASPSPSARSAASAGPRAGGVLFQAPCTICGPTPLGNGFRGPLSRGATPLPQYIGTTQYYQMRYNDFVQRNPGRTPPDYYLEYGNKYIQRFNVELKPKLSLRGEKWIELATTTLQIAFEAKLLENPVAFASMELDGAALREFAFDSHPASYLDAGLSGVGPYDLWLIGTTPDLGDLVGLSGLKQAINTVRGYSTPRSVYASWQLLDWRRGP